ncbi:ferrous iron transport protein A [Candidatus Micrarchaeota archaeon]|nr:ferrous iron transport protein A [Candidatus Micrarchaeota archaeon]
MEKRLSELLEGEKGRITASKGSGPVHKRLLEMGLVRGAIVEIEKVAPLGDPIEIKVKNYNLSLRKSEAENILVDVIE